MSDTLKNTRLRHLLPLAAVLVVLHLGAPAYAQGTPTSPAEVLGRLTGISVRLHLDHAPAREAFAMLSAAIDVPILFRENDPRGLDGDLPLTLTLDHELSALEALELLIDFAALRDACTWQLRGGFIEVGSKQRLSTRSAMVTRAVEITDFRIAAPSNASNTHPAATPADCQSFHEHPYRAAFVALGARGGSCPLCIQRTGTENAEELLRLIGAIIEPGNWAYPEGFNDLADEARAPMRSRARPTHAHRPAEQAAGMMHLHQGRQLLVRAPDFFHRQFAGYPPAVRPAPLSAEELARRAARATHERSSIAPVGLVADIEPRVTSPLSHAPGTLPRAHRAIMDRMLHTVVSLTFDDTPLREALRQLAEAIDVLLIGRWEDDPVGHGLDPAHPVTLTVNNARALDVLDVLLADVELAAGPCTWQIRNGFLEVGTTPRLATSAARVVRVYPIADLMLNVPNFTPAGVERGTAEGRGLDLVRLIVETIEPGTWDHGQPFEQDMPAVRPAADQPLAPGRRGGNPGAPVPRAVHTPLYQPPRQIASIRFFRDLLVIAAPDFYHRQIGGYPRE